jgi:hypothetical protein
MFKVEHEINQAYCFLVVLNNFFIIPYFPKLFDDTILSIVDQFTIIIFSINEHTDLFTIALKYEPTNYNLFVNYFAGIQLNVNFNEEFNYHLSTL